ncbi:hypothetical protein M9Y10_006604 [Tritrichomonas musculus]|uniref:Transmembrane protein n=1 Tax=Tritrichomonas musculus TaxID=1915356 RepID=A0ABR2JGX0_9EUKA
MKPIEHLLLLLLLLLILISIKIKRILMFLFSKQNLVYIYILDIQKPTKILSDSKYECLFKVNDALDFHRFRYYPWKTDIYTFFGFSNQQTMNRSISLSSIRSGSIDHKEYLYKSKINGLQQENTRNQSTSIQQQSQSTSIQQQNHFSYIQQPNQSTSGQQQIQDAGKCFNSNENISIEEPLFCPNSDLYYFILKRTAIHLNIVFSEISILWV